MKYFATIILGLLFCSSCVNDLNKVKALSEKGSGVEVARDIKSYYYGPNGNLKGILTAPVLYRYLRDTPYTLMDSGLKVDFYNDSLQLQSILTARKGQYFEKTSDIIVSDSVVVTTMDNKKLLTDELRWDPKRQEFYNNKPTRIITASQDLYGIGLTAPADLSWYKFDSVSGLLTMKDVFPENADSTRIDSAANHPGPASKPAPPPSASKPIDTTQRP